MSIIDRVAVNARDVFQFGPSFALRHFGRFREDGLARVSVPEVGAIYMRAGDSDADVVRQVFGERQYDTKFRRALDQRVRHRYDEILASGRNPIIVDAGANIGAASLWFEHEYPEAWIVAVEPEAGNCAVLRKNLNGRPNHVILEAAIGSEPGFVQVTNNWQSWGAQTARADTGLPIVTVQEAYDSVPNGEPFIVKIDIEGFERDLFSSNLDWLETCYMVMLEPHDWMLPGQMTSRSFQEAFGRRPFELYMSGENLFYVRV